MIFGNACFLCTRVKGVFFLHACCTMIDGFLWRVIILRAAYTTKVCSRFRWMEVKVGFMAYSFSQDGNREAVPTTRRNGILKMCTPHFKGRQLLVIPSLQMFVFLLISVLLFCDTNFIFCAFFPFYFVRAQRDSQIERLFDTGSGQGRHSYLSIAFWCLC